MKELRADEEHLHVHNYMNLSFLSDFQLAFWDLNFMPCQGGTFSAK